MSAVVEDILVAYYIQHGWPMAAVAAEIRQKEKQNYHLIKIIITYVNIYNNNSEHNLSLA